MPKTEVIIGLCVIALILFGIIVFIHMNKSKEPLSSEWPEQDEKFMIRLPEPDRMGSEPLETVIRKRRSIRNYSDESLSLKDLSQLLWAGQGITDETYGFRSTPSAGALYPLELLVAVGAVDELTPGIYRYVPQSHGLQQISKGDPRDSLCQAALDQKAICEAPVSLVVTAVPNRTTKKYGSRGIQYVHIEVGHAGQNITLQATALDLGSVVIGAFSNKGVAAVLGLTGEEEAYYIIPVGHKIE